jgi:hypothetical protein
MSELPVIGRSLPVCSTPNLHSPYFNVTTLTALTAALFGARAATLSAWYALDARQSRHEGDYRLWLAAFKIHRLQSGRST